MSIQVLMSTYNGEAFLEEQVRSIMKQTRKIDNLLVRDDGSTDSTLEMLHDLKKEYACITIIEGTNIGWRKSFFELLRSSGDYDFYAFSDQDDVWCDNKIECAIEELEKLDEGKPNLCQCASVWVDKGLRRIGVQPTICKPSTSYEAVLNAWAQGAQMVFNRKLRDMARVHEPMFPCAHDVWVYDIAYLMGTVVVPSEELMMYRRHEDSVTTVKNNSLYQRIRAYRKIGRFGNYARELVCVYENELRKQDEGMFHELQMLTDYRENIRHKMTLLRDPQIKKKTFLGTVNLKLQILCSKF